MSWKIEKRTLDGRGEHYTVAWNSQPASFERVYQAWQGDLDFCDLFSQTLADAPFAGFRWETPALTRSTSQQPFEFVLLNDPGLERQPDHQAFARHFATSPKGDVAVFSNMGGDAMLVVPCPQAAPEVYVHLASFLRGAPASQQQTLWQAVGQAVQKRIGDRPLWLNTAGAGVAWLHIRLDDRPKYYRYLPYCKQPAS